MHLPSSHQEYFEYLGVEASSSIITESINLNHWLLNTPIKQQDVFSAEWNILECFEAHINGRFVDLVRTNKLLRISDNSSYYPELDDWLREIVWYGNKRGSYLHRCIPCI